MIKERLIILANHLDAKGLTKEADYLDSIITRKIAQEDTSSIRDYILKYVVDDDEADYAGIFLGGDITLTGEQRVFHAHQLLTRAVAPGKVGHAIQKYAHNGAIIFWRCRPDSPACCDMKKLVHRF